MVHEDEGITFSVKHHYNPLKVFKILVAHLAFLVFFVFATLNFMSKKKNCEKDCEVLFCSPHVLFLLVTIIFYLGLFYYNVVKRYFGEWIATNFVQPGEVFLRKTFETAFSKFILIVVYFGFLITLMVFETRDDFHRLRALIGIISFLSIGYLFSYNKFAIRLRPVLLGFTIQFLLGVLCIRSEVGRTVFKCLSDKALQFFLYAQHGASFVFGNFLVTETNVFAFSVLPTIFYFSLCVSMLYYLGIMQRILQNLGWLLQSILGTTVCESINAAGNIVLSMCESPLLIRPYIKYLTNSELHAIMVSGFATSSGTSLVAYVSYGAEAFHLVTASFMAAPASLFVAKLFYPETEESLTSSDNIQLEGSTDDSLLDAASNGAKNGIEIILSIIASLVAFVAFLTFADEFVKYLTFLVGFEDVGIEFILGKVFIPVSWALGVEWKDCEKIGHVIGTRTFVNEFVAFKLLGEYKQAGEVTYRSSAIATYAVCSFANAGSMGIMIGTLSALAPERRSSITKVAFRALVAACFVSFLTASIAGLLMNDEMIEKEYKLYKNSSELF